MLSVVTMLSATSGYFAPTPVLRPARSGAVAMEALPELYVYDHCPFCVRVRLACGVLGVKHKLVFMGNDDVETPTEMVGKKIAPIWKDADGPMMESLDIIAKVDTENKIKPASGRTDLKAWQKSVQTLMRKLQRPRYVKVPLPEFMQKSGRDAFVNNHQMPPFEKSEWKGNADMSLDFKYGKYEEAFAMTADLLPEANAKVAELEDMVRRHYRCPGSVPSDERVCDRAESACVRVCAADLLRGVLHRGRLLVRRRRHVGSPALTHGDQGPSDRPEDACLPRQFREARRRPALRRHGRLRCAPPGTSTSCIGFTPRPLVPRLCGGTGHCRTSVSRSPFCEFLSAVPWPAVRTTRSVRSGQVISVHLHRIGWSACNARVP